jgi:hypothetical protein
LDPMPLDTFSSITLAVGGKDASVYDMIIIQQPALCSSHTTT